MRTYIPLFAAVTSFLTRIRISFDNVTPSMVVYDPVVVNVAPTPAVPLLYVTTPPEIVANVPVVAALQLSCIFKPCATSSTYCLVAASVELTGVARLIILKLFRLTLPLKLPVPVATKAVVPKLPTLALPVTVKLVNVPVLVMFGCALVVTVAAEPVALPVNAPVNVVALTLPALILPVTLKLVNVPVEVIFGCAAVVTVAAEPVALPVNAPVNVVAETLPALILPVTVKSVSVPVLVMFG